MLENNKKLINAKKTLQAANILYPNEKWEMLEAGIFIAKSRMPRSAEQINTLEKELRQARVLVERGSVIYLLPENPQQGEKLRKFPDAIVDGNVMEFKTITGSLRQVEVRYKEARAKASYIFIKIDAQISRHEFTRKLSGYIKRKRFSGGIIIAYFTRIGEFHQWTEEELSNPVSRQKKSGSNDPAAIQGKSNKPKCPR